MNRPYIARGAMTAPMRVIDFPVSASCYQLSLVMSRVFDSPMIRMRCFFRGEGLGLGTMNLLCFL